MARDPRQTRRVILGSLLTAALIAGAFLVFFLDSILNSFRSEYTVIAVVDEAANMAAGSPVWIAGSEVGEVETVAFLASGADSLSRVALTLLLPRDVQAQVRADSRVRLTSKGFMSVRVVDIVPGTAAAPVLGVGDTLRQDVRLTPAELTAQAALVKADFDSVMLTVNALRPVVNARLLQTQRAFGGLELAMAEGRRMQSDMDANEGLAVLQSPEFAATLQRARTTAGEIPRLLSAFTAQTGRAGEVGAALARLQRRADSLSVQLAAATAALENPNGSLARFQRDSALVRAIGKARADLDSLIAEAKRNPLRFVF
jgi:ABC-type transporter Mla subunit MlaD